MAAPKANAFSLNFASASSQYVSITDNTALKPTGNFTIEFRFKASATPGSGLTYRPFQTYYNNGSTAAGFFIEIRDTGIPRLLSGNNTNLTQGSGYQFVDATQNVCNGHWHHIAGVWNGTQLKIYVDNNLQGTVSWSTAPAYNATNYPLIGIGKENVGLLAATNGNINNVRLWSTALTSFSDSVADETSSANLIAWWRFKEGLGTTLVDVIGGFNGTLTNSPTWSNDVPFTVHESTANTVEAGSGRFLNDPNLISYWKLEDTTDQMGAHSLTNHNIVTFTAGLFNNAANFGTANTNKYLDTGSDMGIHGGVVTIAMRVKMLTEITTGEQYFCDQLENTNDTRYFISYQYNTGTLRLRFHRDKVGVAGVDIFYNIALGTTNWYNLILSYDGTNLYGYVNGVCVGFAATSGNGTAAVGANFAIGSAWDGSSPASCMIDDTLFFNRSFSDADAMDLYISKKVNPVAFSNLSLISDANLQAYWPYDGNSNDSKGTNNGTDTSVTYSTTNAKFNQSANYNGTTSKTVLATAGALEPTGSFSASIWIKSSAGAADTAFLQAYAQNTNVAGFILGISSGKARFLIGKNTGTVLNTDYRDLHSNETINDGKMHHVLFVYDGSFMNIYIDGVLDTHTANTINPAYQATTYCRMGVIDSTGTDGNFYNGSIDDLPFLNRALTADEMALIFYGAGVVTVNVTDSISLVESITKSIVKAISGSISLSETVTPVKVIVQALSDSITLTESITKTVTKAISGSITLVESLAKSVQKAISDTISLSESVVQLKSKIITIVEKIPLYEKVYGWLNNILVFPWRDKYKSAGTTFTDKYQKKGTQWTDKYH